MNYLLLWNEISTDPAGLGYVGKTDAQVAALLNGLTQTVARTAITGNELLEHTVLAELQALTAAGREAYWGLTGLGSIDIAAGSNGRVILLALFGAGTTIRAQLTAFVQTGIVTSRAAILGLGDVRESDVAKAVAQFGGG